MRQPDMTTQNNAAQQPIPRKYILTGNTIKEGRKTLFQIRAVRNIPEIGVNAGDFGGYIESEFNLSHAGTCWVFNGGRVCERARVSKDALVFGAIVKGIAEITDHARVSGDSEITNNARILRYARVDNSYVGGGTVTDQAGVFDGAKVWGDSLVSGKTELYGTMVLDENYTDGCVYYGQTYCPDGYIPDEYSL